jgi:hypothetical protein
MRKQAGTYLATADVSLCLDDLDAIRDTLLRHLPPGARVIVVDKHLTVERIA